MNLRFLSLLLALPLAATTINFDDQATSSGAVQLNSQYASSGVLFNNIYAAQSFKFNVVPPSTPNYASPFWTNLNPGVIDFVDPANSSVNATVTSVSFTLIGLTTTTQNPGFFAGATINALDPSGNLIAGQSIAIPAATVATSNQVLTFTGNIHALEFDYAGSTVGVFPIDNLTFGALTDAPEPSSLALFGGGLLVFVVRRRPSFAWVLARRRMETHGHSPYFPAIPGSRFRD